MTAPAPTVETRLEFSPSARQRVWLELASASQTRDRLAAHASLLSSRAKTPGELVHAHTVGLLAAAHNVRVRLLAATLRGVSS